jgi:WD40 repeat protein
MSPFHEIDPSRIERLSPMSAGSPDSHWWPLLWKSALSCFVALMSTGCVAGKTMRLPVDEYVDAIAWSPDSRYLAASDQRGHHLYVWDTITGGQVFKVPNTAGLAPGLAFTKDGKFILGSLSEGRPESEGRRANHVFSIWSARTGEHLQDVDGPGEKDPYFGASNAERILIGPESNSVVAIFGGGHLIGIYEVGSWKLIKVAKVAEPGEKVGQSIHDAAISPDGHTLALGLSNSVAVDLYPPYAPRPQPGNVWLWKLPEGSPIRRFHGDPNETATVWAVAFSPDGRSLAVGSSVNEGVDEHQLRMWNAETGDLVWAYQTGFKVNIQSISFHPSGRIFATSSYPTLVRIWDAGSPKLLREISAPGRLLGVVAYSPDGRKLAYGGDGGVTITDADAGN